MRRESANVIILLSAWVLFWTLPTFGQEIAAGSNVQVSSAHPDRFHYETVLAADPKNPQRLLGGAVISTVGDNFQHRTIVYASLDAGKSWEPTLEVRAGLISRDPAVAFGPDGTAYFACFAFDPSFKSTYNLFLYRSKDGGRTWLAPTLLPIIDRPYVTVDSSGSKYRGHVYISGNTSTKTFDDKGRSSNLDVFRSLDGGATFEAPVVMAATDGNWVINSSNGVVLSDGTLVLLLAEVKGLYKDDGSYEIPENRRNTSNARLKVVKSEDGGDSFSKAVIVNDFYMDFNNRWLGLAVNSIPTLAVDSTDGAFRDRLYAVWPDVRSGRSEILSSYSSDKGQTWSKPVAVNDDYPRRPPDRGPDDFMPVVTVNKVGVVGVMWYDRRDNPDDLGWWIRFSASVDGGETFLPGVKVSEAANEMNRAVEPIALDEETGGGGNPAALLRGGNLQTHLFLSFFTFNGGDTAGMAADAGGVFHPFWIDNRTGVPQVWTAPVSVRGTALRNGAADFAQLDDISGRVNLDFANASYDSKTKTVTADASLVNTSTETLIGPIVVRVLMVTSKVGKPEILNADNRVKESGAVWDFSSLLESNKLKPSEKLKTKRLVFRLSDVQPIRPVEPGRYAMRFVSLETKVLGKVMKASRQ